jgi:hypothetical protein
MKNHMKKITILLCVLLLSGCSAKFAYNNASWLVYWYLDDYVELNNQQEEQFDHMLSTWFDWHRSNELPKYQAHFEELISDIKTKKIDEALIFYHREKSRDHWERARTHVAPDIVTMGKTLSEKQVSYLFTKLEKENIEDEEEDSQYRDLTLTQQDKKWIKRDQKGAKKWIGKLNNEQKLHIKQFRDRFKKTGNYWLTYKRDYQQALRELFSAPDRSNEFEEKLLTLILYPESYRSEAFSLASDANNKASAEYLIGIMDLADKKQMNRLIEEISNLKQDIISLNKNP